MPWVRVAATRRARPALASQAENASRRTGAVDKLVASSCRVQRERAINKDSIIPSKHRRAESKWVRWKARPVSPNIKAEEKAK